MEAIVSEPVVPAAVGLTAALSELEAPASISPGDDFLAKFNEAPAVEETPAPAKTEVPEPKVEETPENPAPEEKSETPEGEDDPHGEEAPDPKDEKANEKWKAVKSDLKKTREERNQKDLEIQTRDQKIAEFETKKLELEREIAELAEIREKAARVEEVERELSIHKVESSEPYRKAVTEPLNAIGSTLEDIASNNSEVSLEDLENAVTQRDPAKRRAALKEILPSLDSVDQLALARAADDTQAILAKRDQMREDAGNALKELEQKQTVESTKAKEAARKEFKAEVERVAKELKEKFPHIELTKGETADGVFAALMEKAKETDFDAAPASAKAFAALSGIALVRATKVAQHLSTENKTLKARIAELTSAEPKVEGTAPAPANAPQDFLSAFGISPSTSVFLKDG